MSLCWKSPRLLTTAFLVILCVVFSLERTKCYASTITFPDADEPRRFPYRQLPYTRSFSPRAVDDELSKSANQGSPILRSSNRPQPVAAPSIRRSSSAIIFPDAPVMQPELEFVPECDNVTFQALDPATQTCEPLMEQAGCAPGHWFVLERGTQRAGCRRRPCAAYQGLFQGACRPLNDTSLCPPYMRLLLNEFGEAECDCEAGAVYWRRERRCYPAMMRGPCLRHQLLTLDAAGAAVCQENVCGRDGLVRWPETGGCYPLRDLDNAPCVGGRVDVDALTMELRCNTLSVNTAFDTPAFRCSRGSRRFLGNRCKRKVMGSSSAEFVTLDRSRQESRCPQGFRLDRRTGACRRRSPGGLGGLG